METIESYDYKGYRISLAPDEDSPNPITDWDMLGTFECYHPNYDLSNVDPEKRHYTPEDIIKFVSNNEDVVWLPLYLYDHSGITIATTPFSCPWDSGQVGYVYCYKEDVIREFGSFDTEAIQKAAEVMKSEVNTFDMYLRGEVYGFIVEDEDKNHLDSCWGFYGLESAKQAAEESVDYIRSVPNYQI